jgi:hypothetical protein
MDEKYRAFLFQTLYMLIYNSKEEYDLLFGKIEQAYTKYQDSAESVNYNFSEYQAMERFLTSHSKEKI